jgi:hypothetical protein
VDRARRSRGEDGTAGGGDGDLNGDGTTVARALRGQQEKAQGQEQEQGQQHHTALHDAPSTTSTTALHDAPPTALHDAPWVTNEHDSSDYNRDFNR